MTTPGKAELPAIASIDLRQGQDVEVAQVAVGDKSPAAPWRSLGCHKLDICQRPEGVVPCVPPAPVHELAQQLNRRLQAQIHHISTLAMHLLQRLNQHVFMGRSLARTKVVMKACRVQQSQLMREYCSLTFSRCVHARGQGF